MKLAYIGQNQNSGLYPKKFGVIFFKAKLLNPKHGAPLIREYHLEKFHKINKRSATVIRESKAHDKAQCVVV